MRGVGKQGQMDAFAADGGPVIGSAQVVFHVAGSKVVISVRCHAREFAEYLPHGLPYHICQHIEAAYPRPHPHASETFRGLAPSQPPALLRDVDVACPRPPPQVSDVEAACLGSTPNTSETFRGVTPLKLMQTSETLRQPAPALPLTHEKLFAHTFQAPQIPQLM